MMKAHPCTNFLRCKQQISHAFHIPQSFLFVFILISDFDIQFSDSGMFYIISKTFKSVHASVVYCINMEAYTPRDSSV